MNLRRVLVILLICSDMLLCNAQSVRDNEVRLLGGIHIGMNKAKITEPGSPSFTSTNWFATALDLGASLTHRERWGFSVIGALALNGYYFQYDKIKYNLYHQTFRAELQPWWLVPTGRGNRTKLKIGAGLGFSFQSGGSVSTSNRDLISIASAPARNSFFIAPDLTLFNFGKKNGIEIGLRYLYHLDRSAALTTTMTVGNNPTTASATNDHFGLVFRQHIGFKKNEPPPAPIQEVAFQDRENDLLTTLNAKSRRITIEVWDNAEVDGDTISVLLNDRYVLFGHALTKRKERIVIDMPSDYNILEFVAHNEGRVAPNTASCTVNAGYGKKELLIRTSNEKNTTIEINYEPKLSRTLKRYYEDHPAEKPE
ncbi:MAG: hypothetical protein WAR83_16065 [Flavobacteriales bacterium]